MNLSELPKTRRVNINHLPVMAKRQIGSASLPQNYLVAKDALKECDRIDEVKDIGDKHSAIGHYAKQIKDDSLRFYAQRIYIRALHRIGELLSTIPQPKDRKSEAKQHGLGYADAHSAYLISHLSEAELSEMIDKNPPASKTDVHCEGWKRSEYAVRARARYERNAKDEEDADNETSAYEFCDYLFDEVLANIQRQGPMKCRRFSYVSDRGERDYTIDWQGAEYHLPDAMRWAQMLAPDEAAKVRPVILSLIEWLDDFERGLAAGKEGVA